VIRRPAPSIGCLILVPFALLVFCLASLPALAEENSLRELRLDNGLYQIQSKYLTLISDSPIDDSGRALATIFDLAIPEWEKTFGVSITDRQAAQVTAYWMFDRQRYVELGILSPEDNFFRHGYQFEDRLFLMNQPSQYYSRHLLLHEGTHWFLWKYAGGNGPPWYCEGLCEWMGTHRWDGRSLQLGVMPELPSEFPYWGRIKMIREDLGGGSAPSLKEVLNYHDTAHRVDAPYAWSWAAVLFFANHPRYRDDFEKLYQNQSDAAKNVTVSAIESWAEDWPKLEFEWELFVRQLDFGFDLSRASFFFPEESWKPLGQSTSRTISAASGWQSTGILCQADQPIELTPKGRVIVKAAQPAKQEPAWQSEPQGLTLEYFEGKPLGQLVGWIAPIPSNSSETRLFETPIDTFSIDRQMKIRPKHSGILLLRVNESPTSLDDNQGDYQLQISPLAGQKN
jgi:hypothetical protein